MKRSDFFKTLCALPLISLFVKEKVKAEPDTDWQMHPDTIRMSNTMKIEGKDLCFRFNTKTQGPLQIHDLDPIARIGGEHRFSVSLANGWSLIATLYDMDTFQVVDRFEYKPRLNILAGAFYYVNEYKKMKRIGILFDMTGPTGAKISYFKENAITVVPPVFRINDPGVITYDLDMQKDHYGITHIIPKA